MKLGEVIERLEKYREEFGDVEVRARRLDFKASSLKMVRWAEPLPHVYGNPDGNFYEISV